MIQLVTPELGESFLHTCGHDPAGLRAQGLFLSYGLKYPFCEYWIQSDARGACAGITRLDGSVTVCGTPSDGDELSAFLQAVGYSDIFAMGEAGALLHAPIHSTGVTMRLSHSLFGKAELNFHPRLEDVYTVLAGAGEGIALGEHDAWYADASHRIRHGTAKAVTLEHEGKTAACAMVLAQDDAAALLGGVAVLPEYRRKGLGHKTVAGLCTALQKEHKKVVLCCNSGIAGFYEKLGFTVDGEWVLLSAN